MSIVYHTQTYSRKKISMQLNYLTGLMQTLKVMIETKIRKIEDIIKLTSMLFSFMSIGHLCFWKILILDVVSHFVSEYHKDSRVFTS
jgi:hypothetical protein